MTRIERAVMKALGKWSKPPIHVQAITQDKFGIALRLVPMEGDVAGMLVIKQGSAAIAVNSEHSLVRQRFTLAHELGHYLLHANKQHVFVDAPFYRDRTSSLGTEKLEVEANAFASALLMPEMLVREEVKSPVDPLDEARLQRLAHRYEVSVQALVYRLMRLGLMAE